MGLDSPDSNSTEFMVFHQSSFRCIYNFPPIPLLRNAWLFINPASTESSFVDIWNPKTTKLNKYRK